MAEDGPKRDRSWREIAEEVSIERDLDKVTELGQELINALDKQSPSPEHPKERVRRKSA
jgi:hypothetical protein